MNLEKLQSLTHSEKKDLLKEIIINDETYWRKVLILMNMEDDNGLLDKVLENKRAEMDLLEKSNAFIGFSFNELKDRDTSKVIEVFAQTQQLNENYSKACKELVEVLKYIPEGYYNKIDKAFISKINESIDDSYNFTINANDNISNMQLLEETKDLLALIIKKYWSKKEVQQVQPEIKLEDKKISETLMCEYKPKWYEKIFRKIKTK